MCEENGVKKQVWQSLINSEFPPVVPVHKCLRVPLAKKPGEQFLSNGVQINSELLLIQMQKKKQILECAELQIIGIKPGWHDYKVELYQSCWIQKTVSTQKRVHSTCTTSNDIPRCPAPRNATSF